MTQMNYEPPRRGQQIGTFALAAIVCAVGSVILPCTGHPIIGLVAGLLAIVGGLAGFMQAASPRVSGGIVSLASIGIALLGLVLSILGMLGKTIAFLGRH